MIDDDPGWPRLRSSLVFLVPGGLRYGLRRRGAQGADGLLVLRQVFLGFATVLGALGLTIAALYPGSKAPTDPPTAFVAGLLAFGAFGVVIEPRLERPLDCTSDVSLAGTYRPRFFLRMAIANAAALEGFVGFFVTYAWWPYPVGLTIAATSYARHAPTRRNLEREQQRLAAAGCFRSLVRALRGESGR